MIYCPAQVQHIHHYAVTAKVQVVAACNGTARIRKRSTINTPHTIMPLKGAWEVGRVGSDFWVGYYWQLEYYAGKTAEGKEIWIKFFSPAKR